MNTKKQQYRAIKYIWNPEWIGEEAFKKELKCAQQACISEILTDYGMDQETLLTESQLKLTALHVTKYAQCKVIKHMDNCYTKVIMEVLL